MYGGGAACIDPTTGLSIFPFLDGWMGKWPRDVESGPVTWLGFQRDGPSCLAHDLRYDRKPQPRSHVTLGGEIWFPQPVSDLRRDAGSSVTDSEEGKRFIWDLPHLKIGCLRDAVTE